LKKIIITIDGESSSGKTSLAKELAKKIGYSHINTGSMYRAVTFAAFKNKLIIDSKIEFDPTLIIELVNKLHFEFKLIQGVSSIFLNGVNVQKEINSTKVSDYVSQVSTIPEVRKKIVSIQRNLGLQKGVVMEGRDIGSVVFPKAELKFFITADINTRIERRFNELKDKGLNIQKSSVENNLNKRDFLDKNREVSPLIKPEGAILIDNTNLSVNDQIFIIESHIQKIN